MSTPTELKPEAVVGCKTWLGVAPEKPTEYEAAGWWASGWVRAFNESPIEYAATASRALSAVARFERAFNGGVEVVCGASPSH
jgi:hypothetical protein